MILRYLRTGDRNYLPPQYKTVIVWLRYREDDVVKYMDAVAVHTGNYDPRTKDSSSGEGVWVHAITSAIIEPVAWLDCKDFTESLTPELMKEFEARLKVRFKDG